jgi:hypothetical protein
VRIYQACLPAGRSAKLKITQLRNIQNLAFKMKKIKTKKKLWLRTQTTPLAWQAVTKSFPACHTCHS